MIKHFSCGHAETIHSRKDSRRIIVDFVCPRCKPRIRISISSKVYVVGSHTLVIKRAARMSER